MHATGTAQVFATGPAPAEHTPLPEPTQPLSVPIYAAPVPDSRPLEAPSFSAPSTGRAGFVERRSTPRGGDDQAVDWTKLRHSGLSIIGGGRMGNLV